MQLLTKTMAVKLRSHLDKYLVADDNRETVRQSRKLSSTRAAVWLVEPTPKPDIIRLRNSSTGLYLTASDVAFLLGVTGKRVIQSPVDDSAAAAEWEVVMDGFQLKLKTREGKYLRANGGTPPWRNSVTHDVPIAGPTYNWILWDAVDVDVSDEVSIWDGVSLAVGTSVADEGVVRRMQSAMNLFHSAKAVRLRSHHGKYLLAEDDEESVTQDRNGSSKSARWTVEFLDTGDNIIRLKSCYGKYLTASNQPFLLGVTGKKVLQTVPDRLDSSVEWEPIKEGSQVRLRTRYGNFLRANGGVPPWRNSVTHDVPHRSSTKDWILWDVDIVEIAAVDGERKPVAVAAPEKPRGTRLDSFSSESSESRQESNDHLTSTYSPAKPDGRLIYYTVADEEGEVNESTMKEYHFMFKGKSVEELSHKLEEETGFREIVIYIRSPLNGKLVPLRLQLPPNNTELHVVVVPSAM